MISLKLFKLLLIFFILLIQIAPGKSIGQSTEVRDDFKKYYDEYQMEGSFVLYDRNTCKYILYNPDQFKKQFTPASTFKILNSLIGLETGVIADENFMIPWDSVKRNPQWDKDHDLKTAYKNSTVWYYQELARRVGGERMKHWLDTADFGNADTSGGIDKFWLTGGLRITPEEQIGFLIRLNTNMLPFSQRSVDIVKSIMIAKDTLGYIVRGKTGWGEQDNENIGWYVGYLETADNVYYFANCVQAESKSMEDNDTAFSFFNSRKGITYLILNDLGLLEN
jgi:beta-lactamase class D